MKEDLRIRARVEPKTACFEGGSQLAECAALPVVRQASTSVRGRHRLRASLRKIDDGQPAMGETRSGAAPEPLSVRSAVKIAIVHSPERLKRDRRLAVDTNDPGYS